MAIAKTPLVWLTGAILIGGVATAGAIQLSGASASSGGGSATTAKSDFSISAQPGSTTVQVGKSASYAITLMGTGGFTGSVALAASGMAGGVTGTFSPSSVVLGSASQASSTFAVAVAKTTAVGSYTITLTGTSGSGKNALTHSTTVGLTVQKQAGSLSVTATPSPLTLEAGASGTYNITVTRSGAAVGAPVTLSLAGLPPGATSTFAGYDPATVSSSSVQVSLASSTATGNYTLSLNATAGDYSATTAVSLAVVAPSGKAFTIADPAVSVLPLAPGAPVRALDLRISNPNNQQLVITNITVSINQPISSTCTQANFAVTQIPSGYPIIVPANASNMSLSSLAPSLQLPLIQMLDLKSNQDACKSQSVTLAYAGTGNSY